MIILYLELSRKPLYNYSTKQYLCQEFREFFAKKFLLQILSRTFGFLFIKKILIIKGGSIMTQKNKIFSITL